MKKLKRRVQAEVEKLDQVQKDFLVFGRCLLQLEEPFRDAGHRRAVWDTHGAAIVRDYVQKYPGRRPSAWWLYEKPEPRVEGETDPAYLRRLGLLGLDEIGRLSDSAYTSSAKTRSAV